MAVELMARKTPSSVWVKNFSNHGWRVRPPTGTSWIIMTPSNTKIRSADNSTWLNVK